MNMIQRAQKKPVIIEVCQWTGNNDKEIINFCQDAHFYREFTNGNIVNAEITPWKLIIYTLEGEHQAEVGDYIIKGVHGEFYPCKPDIFKETYDIVE